MVRHIVWWTIKPEAAGKKAEENIAFLLDAAKILNNVESALSVEISSNIHNATLPCQLILTTTHQSLDKLDEYQKDPIHVKFAENLKLMAASRNCIDFIY